MKKFSINCDFGGQISPFDFYIGQPEATHHPIKFQSDWLSKERGGTVPAEVMDAIAKLKDLSIKNDVSLEELCEYALEPPAEEDDSTQNETTTSDDEESDQDADNSDESLEDSEITQDDEFDTENSEQSSDN